MRPLISCFCSAGVIHQVVYGLLLLNTDLHVADHDRRMTRPQFVENVLSSIRTEMDSSGAADKHSSTARNLLNATQLSTDEAALTKRDSDFFYEASSTTAADSVASLSDSHVGQPGSPRDRGSIDSPMSPSIARNPSGQGGASSAPASSPMTAVPSGSGVASDLRGLILRKESAAGLTGSRAWFGEMDATLRVPACRDQVLSRETSTDIRFLRHLQDLYSSVKSQPIVQPMDDQGGTANDRRPSMTLSPSSQSSVTRSRSVRTPSSTSIVNKRSSIRGFGTFGASLASIGQVTATSSSSGGRLSPTPTVATSMHEVSSFGPSLLASCPLTSP